MAKDLSFYTALAENMIAVDRDRDKAFGAYQKMVHSDWSLPGGIEEMDWIRKVVSTDPHDAVMAGVRVLSSIRPKPTVLPPLPDKVNKDRANEIERNLSWQLMSANRRRPTSVEADVIQSALTYMSVAMMVIDLDWQIDLAESLKADSKRLKAARKVSRFVVNTYNPMDVHMRRSSFGTEAVLLCQERLASDVYYEWGDAGTKLEPFIDAGLVGNYYDYMDYETHVVWFDPGSGSTVELLNGEHELDFINWIALMGGSTLENEELHKYHPMLYPVYMSGAWETQNVVKTLYTSEVIANAASPRYSDEGPNPDHADLQAGDVTRTAKPAAGNQLRTLNPPSIDVALTEVDDRLASSLEKSTVSRILMGGDVPSGTAFASLNLATQTAVGALKPAQELAEKALAEMFTQMILWTKHTNKALDAYGVEKDIDLGQGYILEPDEIDEERIYITVELTADVPTDRMQRMNAASMAVAQLNYPIEYALEDVGVEDPQRAIRIRELEKLQEHKLDLLKQQEIMRMQMEIQNMQMEMQNAQAQEQQQAGAQEQAMQQQVQPPLGGNGVDPAMGGMPPAMANPAGVTREAVTGQDVEGNEIAEVPGL